MNYRDLRNVLLQEYGEFLESGSDQRLAAAFEEEVAARRRACRFHSRQSEIDYLKTSWFESHPPGFVERRKAFSPSYRRPPACLVKTSSLHPWEIF